MKTFFNLSLTLSTILFKSIICASTLQTETFVDIPKYMGQWYEIAHINSAWENTCSLNKKVFYSLRNDGSISVVNECPKGKYSLEDETAKGRMWIVDKQHPAKLKISYLPLTPLQPYFSGDYWIILLAPDYSYAVISEPTQTYLWILSRTPTLPTKIYQNILHEIQQRASKINLDHLVLANSLT